MDGLSGRPGTGSSGTQPPGTATAFGSSYIAGLAFEVTQGGWFEGYWWWVAPSGGLTAPQKFCLWQVTHVSPRAGTLITAATVTSGTMTTGWNWVPVAPVQLALGTVYVAATGVNGNFPDTTGQFGTGQPYAAGITNGPLHLYGNSSTDAAPYSMPQGPFSTGGSDPAVTIPDTNNANDLLWLDVQVNDTAPATFTGPYRLWPNKFDTSAATVLDQPKTFTLATEFRLSQAGVVSAVWYPSVSGAASLATEVGIFRVSDQALMASNASPSWTKADGVTAAAAGDGWVRTTIGPVPLQPDSYKVAYYNGAGTISTPTEFGYYGGAGAGANGIVNGPLSAPSDAAASTAYIYVNAPAATPPNTGIGQEPGQGTFVAGGAFGYPYLAVDYLAPGASDPAGAHWENFWADVEFTATPPAEPVVPVPWQFLPAAAPGEPFAPWPPWGQPGQPGITVAGTASLAGAGAVSALAAQAAPAVLAGTGALAAVTVQGAGASPAGAGSATGAAVQQAGAPLAGAGSLSALAVQRAVAALAGAGALTASQGSASQGTAALAGSGALTATGTVLVPGTASLAGAGSLAALAALRAAASAAGTGALTATGAAHGPVSFGRATADGHVQATATAAGAATTPAIPGGQP
jgi:hypothetical protein